ncbi:MAG: urea ABC transporter permease subunit UrtB [Gallionellales bacterium 35-53-114]|jgi:urea transport system permease protein|nr:MAG: urea ABC transporter permease subunit UrtB [Gallionellales bacterium 35-53-114]OYZ65247.1 MAG: urea ABC transporter permease subunit UrtB [Gallionellales bacterium 24-53-125]OZB08153.1 MAG: urea ABC transporter permease subunit UrtB [Gallionellales bacterium 39-52-133]HQS58078.1 urea ABC transporter permease subunit UrtB [Gallionellaceae bacterium]HQS73633.1 urea ABC transporter permease subunit UrtB [Gallionellaceae bacterium]
MFGYSMAEIGNIFVMQGFSGLSLFSVLLLMALGLAIIFGQMGVINMAHGEFMALGAYTTVLFSQLAVAFDLVNYYFVFAIIAAFIVAFVIGYLVEFGLIRHLYKRPLDTLLATWGLSLVMQQIFRSTFGAKEVSAELPAWLLGSFKPTEDIDIPINGVFVMGLAVVVTVGVLLFMFRSNWGLRVRATVQNRVMAGAVGINTKKVDRVTFALGCGIAGVAGAAFTTIASTGPTTGSLYIVDSFMVVVFGGAASVLGTIASAFGIAQAQSILQFFLTSSMGKVATLMTIVVILMMKPEGLFAAKLRK